jgi:hypothetical protein
VINIIIGAALGLAAGAFGAFILFKVVKLLGPGDKTPTETAFTFLGFLLKWPLIFGLGYLAYTLSMEAVYAFAIGVFVVYSSTVWRALRGRLF